MEEASPAHSGPCDVLLFLGLVQLSRETSSPSYNHVVGLFARPGGSRVEVSTPVFFFTRPGGSRVEDW